MRFSNAGTTIRGPRALALGSPTPALWAFFGQPSSSCSHSKDPAVLLLFPKRKRCAACDRATRFARQQGWPDRRAHRPRGHALADRQGQSTNAPKRELDPRAVTYREPASPPSAEARSEAASSGTALRRRAPPGRGCGLDARRGIRRNRREAALSPASSEARAVIVRDDRPQRAVGGSVPRSPTWPSRHPTSSPRCVTRLAQRLIACCGGSGAKARDDVAAGDRPPAGPSAPRQATLPRAREAAASGYQPGRGCHPSIVPFHQLFKRPDRASLLGCSLLRCVRLSGLSPRVPSPRPRPLAATNRAAPRRQGGTRHLRQDLGRPRGRPGSAPHKGPAFECTIVPRFPAREAPRPTGFRSSTPPQRASRFSAMTREGVGHRAGSGAPN